jgi:hypothetical protein
MASGPDLSTDPATFCGEESPLLERTTALPVSKSSWRRLLKQHVITLCLILIVLVEIGVYLQTAPLNKLIEQIICNEHLTKTTGESLADPEDPRCKSAEVQGRLAMLRGWQATFECIPSTLVILSLFTFDVRY